MRQGNTWHPWIWDRGEYQAKEWVGPKWEKRSLFSDSGQPFLILSPPEIGPVIVVLNADSRPGFFGEWTMEGGREKGDISRIKNKITNHAWQAGRAEQVRANQLKGEKNASPVERQNWGGFLRYVITAHITAPNLPRCLLVFFPPRRGGFTKRGPLFSDSPPSPFVLSVEIK